MTPAASRRWTRRRRVLLAGASIGIALVVAPGVALFVAMLIFVGLLLVRYAIGRRHSGRSESA